MVVLRIALDIVHVVEQPALAQRQHSLYAPTETLRNQEIHRNTTACGHLLFLPPFSRRHTCSLVQPAIRLLLSAGPTVLHLSLKTSHWRTLQHYHHDFLNKPIIRKAQRPAEPATKSSCKTFASVARLSIPTRSRVGVTSLGVRLPTSDVF